MDIIANDLQVGFKILWYEIKSVLGRGGFGVTYLAEDTNLNRLVAIKEYLPFDFASRDINSKVSPNSFQQSDIYSWGLNCFMSEAQTLAGFRHHNIVRVLSVFKHNNTGYMVMEYEQGRVLSEIYEEGRTLSQADMEQFFFPIMDGLKAVHAEGFIHRDIKPDNIYIRNNGSPVLLDFGSARQAVGGKTRTLTALLTAGYAPFEQYQQNLDSQGSWTDIYSLGACLLQGITGEKPVESPIRGMAVIHNKPDPYKPLSFSHSNLFSRPFLRAIDEALMLHINERPQTLDDFISMLRGEIELPNLSTRKFQSSISVVCEKTVIRPKIPSSVLPVFDSNSRSSAKLSETPPALFGKTKGNAFRYIITVLIVLSVLCPGILVALLYPFEISQEESQLQKITALLNRADLYFESGNYHSSQGENAIGLYHQVMNLDPGNPTATSALESIGKLYLQKAELESQKNDFFAANRNLEIVDIVSPNFSGLGALKAKIIAKKEFQKALLETERKRKAEANRIKVEKLRLAEEAKKIKAQQEELVLKEEENLQHAILEDPSIPDPPREESKPSVIEVTRQKQSREDLTTGRSQISKVDRLRNITARN